MDKHLSASRQEWLDSQFYYEKTGSSAAVQSVSQV